MRKYFYFAMFVLFLLVAAMAICTSMQQIVMNTQLRESGMYYSPSLNLVAAIGLVVGFAMFGLCSYALLFLFEEE